MNVFILFLRANAVFCRLIRFFFLFVSTSERFYAFELPVRCFSCSCWGVCVLEGVV